MHWLLGVVTGFVIWTVLFLGGNVWVARAIPGATDTDGVIVSATALGSIVALTGAYSVLAGAVASRLSGAYGRRAALVLGGLLLVVGAVVQSGYWEKLPLWYHLSFLAQLVPASWAGHIIVSHLRTRRP